jgi:C_GCAxxG_C_C family probable redox protein
MTPEEMKEKAILIMNKRYHCSQTVVAVGLEKLGQEPNEGLVRSMGAFAGGLATTGHVCGSLVGALAVFGLVFSRSKEEEKEDPLMWSYSQEFLRCFREEIVQGSILCRDIIGVDWKDKNQIRDHFKGETRRECLRITGETAKIVGEMLDQYLAEKKCTDLS